MPALTVQPMDSRDPPDKLYFDISAFPGTHITLQIEGEQLIYTWFNSTMPDAGKQVIIEPDESAWQTFWRTVDDLGVWHWRNNYDEICSCDGIKWQLEFAHGGRVIQSEGDTTYPPDGRDIPSKAFKSLLRAFGELMQDDEFIREWYYESWE